MKHSMVYFMKKVANLLNSGVVENTTEPISDVSHL